MMQSASSSQSQTQTVTPGQPIPETEPTIEQIDRNVHGFVHPHSRNRASSCPERTTSPKPLTQPASSSSANPHPQNRNRNPKPNGTPSGQVPNEYYIGEAEDRELLERQRIERQAKLAREEEKARQAEAAERLLNRDYWAEATEQHRQRLSNERKAREAVTSPVSYTHLTLPTIYSV